MPRLPPIALLLLIVLGAAPVAAQPPDAGAKAMDVRLVAEGGVPAAGGEVAVAVAMRPSPGWHGYWKNPGDAGVEPRIAWRLPPGVTADPLRYPVPDRLLISGLMNYVYAHDYALLTKLHVPAAAATGVLPVRASLDYLACTDRICVPQHADLALDLAVQAQGTSAPPRRAQFDAWRSALPRPLGSPARFEVRDGRLRLAIPLPASVPVKAGYLFPATSDALTYAAPQSLSRRGDLLILETGAGADAARLSAVDGVLEIGDGQGLEVQSRPGEVPPAGTPVGEREAAGGTAALLLVSLLGAIAGGLLLNIMPCVFPILSLKALSLARAGEDERTARHEALAYSAGVILTCLAIGGLLLALRAGGSAAGWAFQLQDPRIILFLLLLVLAIALNLAGLFELPTFGIGGRLADSGGTGGAFWTGALAAFIATPCTGPFMGAALGAALVLPGAAALTIFAGLGLGLALPFLLIGFVPGIRRRLPRPGAWMGRLRRWLSVPMFLTVAGLAWILSRQAGMAGLALGLAAAAVLALGLWLAGKRQASGRAWVPLVPAAAAALAGLLLIPSVAAPAANAGAVAGARPFSEARLAALRGEGRPVFLYFTADWCLTCKVNEKAVLERSEVGKALAAHHVAVMVGDWTRGDPAISRFLEQQGRSGVPLYLYYPPGGEPQVLPQLLTVGEVTAALG